MAVNSLILLSRTAAASSCLCGMTRDFSWLLDNGYRVAGAELSERAIKQLFKALGVEPSIFRVGALDHYHAKDIEILVGDIFDLSAEVLGPVDAVYDRAALVALLADMRVQFSAHLMQITDSEPQLLICCEYDQQQIAGPPFSIGKTEVNTHYGERYALTHAESKCIEGGLKGLATAIETGQAASYGYLSLTQLRASDQKQFSNSIG